MATPNTTKPWWWDRDSNTKPDNHKSDGDGVTPLSHRSKTEAMDEDSDDDYLHYTSSSSSGSESEDGIAGKDDPPDTSNLDNIGSTITDAELEELLDQMQEETIKKAAQLPHPPETPPTPEEVASLLLAPLNVGHSSGGSRASPNATPNSENTNSTSNALAAASPNTSPNSELFANMYISDGGHQTPRRRRYRRNQRSTAVDNGSSLIVHQGLQQDKAVLVPRQGDQLAAAEQQDNAVLVAHQGDQLAATEQKDAGTGGLGFMIEDMDSDDSESSNEKAPATNAVDAAAATATTPDNRNHEFGSNNEQYAIRSNWTKPYSPPKEKPKKASRPRPKVKSSRRLKDTPTNTPSEDPSRRLKDPPQLLNTASAKLVNENADTSEKQPAIKKPAKKPAKTETNLPTIPEDANENGIDSIDSIDLPPSDDADGTVSPNSFDSPSRSSNKRSRDPSLRRSGRKRKSPKRYAKS